MLQEYFHLRCTRLYSYYAKIYLYRHDKDRTRHCKDTTWINKNRIDRCKYADICTNIIRVRSNKTFFYERFFSTLQVIDNVCVYGTIHEVSDRFSRHFKDPDGIWDTTNYLNICYFFLPVTISTAKCCHVTVPGILPICEERIVGSRNRIDANNY